MLRRRCFTRRILHPVCQAKMMPLGGCSVWVRTGLHCPDGPMNDNFNVHGSHQTKVIAITTSRVVHVRTPFHRMKSSTSDSIIAEHPTYVVPDCGLDANLTRYHVWVLWVRLYRLQSFVCTKNPQTQQPVRSAPLYSWFNLTQEPTPSQSIFRILLSVLSSVPVVKRFCVRGAPDK